MLKKFIVGALCVLALLAGVVRCVHVSAQRDAEAVEKYRKAVRAGLAQEVKFIVGGERLIAPLVLMRGTAYLGTSFTLDRTRDIEQFLRDREAFLRASAAWETAPSPESIEISTSAAHSSDLRNDLTCDRIERKWVSVLCSNPFDALRLALPVNERFVLLDLDKLDSATGRRVANCLDPNERLSAVNLELGKPVMLCRTKVYPLEGKTKFHTAAVRIQGRLGAVWVVWDSTEPAETAPAMLVREGRAIGAVVRSGLGEPEDFATLHAEVCATMRPFSKFQVRSKTGC